MENPSNKFSLKLLIDRNSNKVLFAEGSKDVVDFIFSLLELPLGGLLTKECMVGSIGEIYHSLSTLDGTHILSNKETSSLLNPTLASTFNPKSNFLLPPVPPQDAKDRRIYTCSSRLANCTHFSEVEGATCPNCNGRMDTMAIFVGPKADSSLVDDGSEGEGYGKGEVTYIVMDDLTVVPKSNISNITLLKKFQIKDLGSLEEKTVSLGIDEGLKLLQASLQSKTVLTDVFLRKNHASTA